MRVFIGMETSGVSRRAFAEAGHDAISCDLLAADNPEDWPYHRPGDVFVQLERLRGEGWWPDLAIFHPTCTYLTYSAEWAYKDPDFDRYPGVGYHQKVAPETLVGAARRAARVEAICHFDRVLALDIERICAENPAGAYDRVSPGFQSVQPYMFGDDASKETHLHLKGLKPLEVPPRNQWVPPRMVKGLPRWANQTDSGQNRLSPGANRWKDRSKTYGGIAAAFVRNWANAGYSLQNDTENTGYNRESVSK